MTRRLGTILLVGRRVALVVVLVCLLLGVGNRQGSTERAPRLDVIFVVDRTTSMSALDDPSGSRITALRNDLIRLSRYLDAARFGIVTFGKGVDVDLPLTSDRSELEESVRDLQVEAPREGTGSSVGRPVAEIGRQLALSTEKDDRLTVVILATDGESTKSGPRTSYAGVGEKASAAVVIGYGTASGGVMPIRQVPPDQLPPPEEDADPLIPDPRTGKPAKSKLDEGTLEQIADELGGTYVHSGEGSDMRQVADAVTKDAYGGLPPIDPDREVRWIWALALLALGLVELAAGFRLFVVANRELRV